MNTKKIGRPHAIMSKPNQHLDYMKTLYQRFHTVDEILNALNVTYQTFYRWNTGKTTPNMNSHIEALEKLTGYDKESIRLQHAQLALANAKLQNVQN